MTLTATEKQKLVERAIAGVTEEETLAAALEIERKKAAKDAVIPVRLDHNMYSSVRSIATERHLPVSVVVRQWITQGVAAADSHTDVAAELERLASVVRAEHAA